MTLRFMSEKELSRLEILRDLGGGRLTTSVAAELLGLDRRQVQRLAKVHQEQGATALISKKRGRPSNRQAPTGLKEQALELIRAKYTDFGPTLAAEKLREVHGITVGRETLRLWMLDAGLWADRVKRRGRDLPAPLSPGVRRRAGAGRWLRALVVRGSRPAMHPARLHRRRHQRRLTAPALNGRFRSGV
jgi:hypothetical protein